MSSNFEAHIILVSCPKNNEKSIAQMKVSIAPFHYGSGVCALAGPMARTKLVLVPLTLLLWAVALTYPVFGAQAAAVLTTLHSFGFPLANPKAGLVQASDGNFYGTTEFGGTKNAGTVFKISTNRALTTLYSFTGGNDGANPVAALVQATDGDLYGTTYSGVTNKAGTVFKISTKDYTLTTLYSFGTIHDSHGNPLDGANPNAPLIQGSDGKFYGITSSGGPFTADTQSLPSRMAPALARSSVLT